MRRQQRDVFPESCYQVKEGIEFWWTKPQVPWKMKVEASITNGSVVSLGNSNCKT